MYVFSGQRKIKRTFYKKPEVTRFIRFCIIGLSSFLFAFTVFNVSYALTGMLIFSSTLAYVLSVINGFIWNRLWTFKDRRGKPFWNQFIRFVSAYIVGYGINLIAYATFLATIHAFQNGIYSSIDIWNTTRNILQGHAEHYSFLLVNAAGVAATVVVIIWNYFANFFWSFQKQSS